MSANPLGRRASRRRSPRRSSGWRRDTDSSSPVRCSGSTGDRRPGTTALPLHHRRPPRPAARHRVRSIVSTPHQYTVVGGGAIGGTLAFHLARSGHPVTWWTPTRSTSPPSPTTAWRAARRREHRRTRHLATAPDGGPATVQRVILASRPRRPAGALAGSSRGWRRTASSSRSRTASTSSPSPTWSAPAARWGLREPVRRRGRPGRDHRRRLRGPGRRRARRTVPSAWRRWSPTSRLGGRLRTTNVSGFLWSKLGFGSMLTATALADAPMADLIDRHRELMPRWRARSSPWRPLGVRSSPSTRSTRPSTSEAGPPAGRRPTGWSRGCAHSPRTAAGSGATSPSPAPPKCPRTTTVLKVAADAGVPVPLLTSLLSQITELERGVAMSEDRLYALGSAR